MLKPVILQEQRSVYGLGIAPEVLIVTSAMALGIYSAGKMLLWQREYLCQWTEILLPFCYYVFHRN